MLGPDLSGLVFLFWAVMSFPLLLGTIAIFLSGAEGASAGCQLARGRWSLAVAVAGAIGCSVLGGAAAAGWLVIVWAGLAGFLLALLVGSALGGLVAYRVAWMVGVRLCRYRCRACGGRFRSLSPAAWCPLCAEERERVAVGRALAEFPTRLRDLGARRHAEPLS